MQQAFALQALYEQNPGIDLSAYSPRIVKLAGLSQEAAKDKTKGGGRSKGYDVPLRRTPPPGAQVVATRSSRDNE